MSYDAVITALCENYIVDYNLLFVDKHPDDIFLGEGSEAVPRYNAFVVKYAAYFKTHGLMVRSLSAVSETDARRAAEQMWGTAYQLFIHAKRMTESPKVLFAPTL